MKNLLGAFLFILFLIGTIALSAFAVKAQGNVIKMVEAGFVYYCQFFLLLVPKDKMSITFAVFFVLCSGVATITYWLQLFQRMAKSTKTENIMGIITGALVTIAIYFIAIPDIIEKIFIK
jgi:hypothetical protein